MWSNKNLTKDLISVLLKTIFIIVGINIFITSLLSIVNLELKKNLKSEINLNIGKLKND